MTRDWYPRQHVSKGHIDPPTMGRSTWEPSDPARRVEARDFDRRHREANPVLKPGMLVIHNRRPKRVIEIRELPDDLWPEVSEREWRIYLADHERFNHDEPPTARSKWRNRPIGIVLALDEPGAKHDHRYVPASRVWEVLPEHYMVCRACGQLPPCDDELAERTIDAAMGQAEHLMSIQSGCCLGCGDPITSRMTATRFPGPNLWRPDMADGSAVFHARAGCSSFVYRYREQWQARSGTPAEQTLPID